MASVTESPVARVFISYARRDSETADKLSAALAARRVETRMDRSDIAPGEDWQARLSDLIAGSEKVLALISPSSIQSEICRWEIAHAAQVGKAILPIVIKDVDATQLPDAVARLNFVYMRDQAELDRNLPALAQAILTDIAWERESVRLTEAARAWEWSGRSDRALLASVEAITAAETWLAANHSGPSAPTALQEAFITRSRARSQRRRRVLRTVSGATAAVLAGLGAVAIWQAFETDARRVEGAVNAATAVLLDNRPLDAVGIALSALPTADTRLRRLNPDVATVLGAAVAQQHVRAIIETDGPVVSAALSDDGALIAANFSGNQIKVIETATGRTLFQTRLESGVVTALAISADQTNLVVGYLSGRVMYANIRDGQDLRDFAARDPDHWQRMQQRETGVQSFNSAINALVFCGQSEVVSTSSLKPVQIWSLGAGTEKGGFPRGPRINDVACSADGRYLAMGLDNGRLQVLDRTANAFVLRDADHPGTNIQQVQVSPDARTLASAGADGSLRIWSLQAGRLVRELKVGFAVALSFMDADRLAVTTRDGVVTLYSLDKDRIVATLDLAFPEGAFVNAASKSGRVLARSREAPNGFEVQVLDLDMALDMAPIGRPQEVGMLGFNPPGGGVYSLAVSTKGSLVATGHGPRSIDVSANDRVVNLWDAAQLNKLHRIELNPDLGPVVSLAFSNDGETLYALAGLDDVVRRWTPHTLDPLRDLAGFSAKPLRFAHAAGAPTLAVSLEDRTVVVQDLARGQVLQRLPEQDSRVFALALSADGTHLATGSETGEVAVWSRASPDPVFTQRADGRSNIAHLALSPDAQHLAVTWPNTSRGEDATDASVIHIYHLPSGMQVARLETGDRVRSIAFSREGARLASGHDSGHIRLWDMTTGALLGRSGRLPYRITALAFDPVAPRIIVGLGDGSGAVWTYAGATTNAGSVAALHGGSVFDLACGQLPIFGAEPAMNATDRFEEARAFCADRSRIAPNWMSP